VNVYVADTDSSVVRQIVISTGAVTTLAGKAFIPGSTDGTGANARLNQPIGITTDGTSLYVADTTNMTIRKIVISTGAVTTLAGMAGHNDSTDGTGSAAKFNYPQGITTDGSSLYVNDMGNNSVRKIE
jgi:sugar lactone lactonase YvrE